MENNKPTKKDILEEQTKKVFEDFVNKAKRYEAVFGKEIIKDEFETETNVIYNADKKIILGGPREQLMVNKQGHIDKSFDERYIFFVAQYTTDIKMENIIDGKDLDVAIVFSEENSILLYAIDNKEEDLSIPIEEVNFKGGKKGFNAFVKGLKKDIVQKKEVYLKGMKLLKDLTKKLDDNLNKTNSITLDNYLNQK